MFTNKMIWQIDEYMLYCQSKQLSEKTMESYEPVSYTHLDVYKRQMHDDGLEITEHPALDVREYIYDMATVMRAADLVICRAGASTPVSYTHLYGQQPKQRSTQS